MVSTIDIDKCEVKLRLPIVVVAKLRQIAERTRQPARNPPIIGKKLRKEDAPASMAYLLTQYAQEKVKDEVLNKKWKKWVSERTTHNKDVQARFKKVYREMKDNGTYKMYPRKGSKKWLENQAAKKAANNKDAKKKAK